MSLFDKIFNKKKDDNAVSILGKSGYVMNTGEKTVSGNREDRKTITERIKGEAKIDTIVESLKILYKELSLNGYEEYAETTYELIHRIKRQPQINDIDAMLAIDALILRTINEVLEQCNRRNYLGIGKYLGALGEYFNDRASDTICYYYKDKRFLKFIVQKTKCEVILSVKESQIRKKRMEMEKLHADFKNPALGLFEDEVARRLGQIKTEAGSIQREISNIENEIRMYSKAIEEIKIALDNGSVVEGFDPFTEMEDIFVTKGENEEHTTTTTKYIDKLNQSHQKVKSDDLTVDDVTFNTSSASVNLSDDDFTF